MKGKFLLGRYLILKIGHNPGGVFVRLRLQRAPDHKEGTFVGIEVRDPPSIKGQAIEFEIVLQQLDWRRRDSSARPMS